MYMCQLFFDGTSRGGAGARGFARYGNGWSGRVGSWFWNYERLRAASEAAQVGPVATSVPEAPPPGSPLVLFWRTFCGPR